MSLLFLPLLISIVLNVKSDNTDRNSLIFVHAIFRHGQRTPSRVYSFPTDKYKDEKYYPYGPGGLTRKGQRDMYDLGQYLRTRYDSFLGKTYFYGLLESFSSNLERSVMTLELVHAGLFPPPLLERWNFFLRWQPIPFKILPSPDKLFQFTECESFKNIFDDLLTNKYEEDMKRDEGVFYFLTNHTGKNISDYLGGYQLLDNFKTKQDMGQDLPEWNTFVYPEFLETMPEKLYQTFVDNSNITHESTSGIFWTKIINDSKRKINSTLPDRKMSLYSGHDTNLASILYSLKKKIYTAPDFGDTIMVELHKIQEIYGIKVFHKTSKNETMIEIPGCGTFCPIDQFESSMQEYITENEEVYCKPIENKN